MKTTTDSNKELINGGLFVLGPGIFGQNIYENSEFWDLKFEIRKTIQ